MTKWLHFSDISTVSATGHPMRPLLQIAGLVSDDKVKLTVFLKPIWLLLPPQKPVLLV